GKQPVRESSDPNLNAASQVSNYPSPKIEPQGSPVLETKNSDGSRLSELIKASAILDNIRVIGRDCEWALKVTNDKTKCKPFLEKLGPGGEWSQTTQLISEITSDKSHADDYLPELRRIKSTMEDVVRYKEFMLSNLGVR
ncbi:MAG: hypothetical protein ABTQ25_02535, partial [Nitrosomonas ureae]